MAATRTCTRKGCGQSFDPSAPSNDGECHFHPGAPVFHEGLKSWSCCADTNKPVTGFDEFLSIKGCATGSHSIEAPVAPPKPEPAPVAAPSSSSNGVESYGAPAPLPPAPKPVVDAQPKKPVSTEYVEEQDDPDVTVEKGATCKRKACGVSWDGEDRKDEVCKYHPGAPIFHEGSKGYSCCKRRVLDFDEFLGIEGCRKGKHLYVGAKKEDKEELVECRVDHYQTPRSVIVSIFGKNADKELSKITFEEETLHVDLILPSRKRFTKSYNLYGPIDPATCSFRIIAPKVEVTLAKADARSWPSITALDPTLSSNFVAQLAFSAGGGRGTTGSKQMVLDEENKRRQEAAAKQ